MNSMEMDSDCDSSLTKKRKYEIVPVDEMDADTVCGMGWFRPQWIQAWVTPRTYLFFYCLAGIVQGTHYSYFVGCLTTLEKRYAYKSAISGSFMTADEISPLLLGVVVGYFGGRSHRPRVIACGMLFSVLCSLFHAIPYFIYGGLDQFVENVSISNGTTNQFCSWKNGSDCEKEEQSPTTTVVILLLLGNFFKGFGNVAFYTIGLSFLDDTGEKRNMPIYFCLMEALRMLGPILGYVMASASLQYYENPWEDPGYGPEDPRWIGAWWIGFVIQGAVLFFCCIPIMLFPRRLPGQKSLYLPNENKESLKEVVLGFFKAIARLSKNPLFMLLCLGPGLLELGYLGLYGMVPKYMESQFRFTASQANLASGPPALVTVQICIILGGIVVWKLKPNSRRLMTGMAVSTAIGTFGIGLLMIPSCRDISMVGATITDKGLELQNECNSNCSCRTKMFSPVCAADGISNFFSPCHAGCTAQNELDNEVYSNCSCVLGIEGNYTNSGSVKKGYCPEEECWYQALTYILILPIMTGFTAIWGPAHLIVLLRSVDPKDKSVGMGIFEMGLSVFAAIPGPIIYGSLVDSACLVWDESCGENGNCWHYDTVKFKYLYHGAGLLFSTFATVCYIVTIFFSDRVKKLYSDDDDDYEQS